MAEEEDLNEDANMTPASQIPIPEDPDGDIGMTPQSQRSTEAPSYVAPMGTDTSEEDGDQRVHTPMGTTGTDAAPLTEVTPIGMTATVGGAGIQIAQPSEVSPHGMVTDGEAEGQPAGPEVVTPNGTTAAEGPATFDMAADDETAEYDDCLPGEVWELILSMRGTSVRQIHPGQFVSQRQKEA